ncbi:MAG: homocitrate synthase [Chloroflexota bacterium]|nr:homocitrate synthase [Chloroflexota bacterium]
MGKVYIDDTTLRDGEQTAGIVFANSEKIQIAKLLAEIGVPQIEAGVPAMGGDEKEAIKRIVDLGLDCSILGWNRAVVADVQHSLDCGVDAVAVSISSSDIHIQHKLRKNRQWVLDAVKRSVDFAKDHGLYVSVNAEDSSRSDPEFLLEFARTAKEHGADRLRYCDTVGMMDPFRIYEQVKMLIDEVGLPIEMHTHNDFGMATADALAGIRAGATYVNTTVNGLGERAGNAALEEVVMALKYLNGQDIGIDTTRLRELSEYVSHASGRFLPTWKAIVGDNIFTHESGIHADGVLKYPQNYEAFPPEAVGLTRQLIIGKHSGSAAILHKFQEFNIKLTRQEAADILKQARSMSVELKRSLFDKELMYIYRDYIDEGTS